LARDDAIFEIGCGTGRATQGLARLGASVLALNPDPALLEVATGVSPRFRT
jgi:16S rRNA A1518/A1519 N6-dimethyltransferase RsmA/KsgA/DIM1 with predicted DNA glycosylase/AP lyase activity